MEGSYFVMAHAFHLFVHLFTLSMQITPS